MTEQIGISRVRVQNFSFLCCVVAQPVDWAYCRPLQIVDCRVWK